MSDTLRGIKMYNDSESLWNWEKTVITIIVSTILTIIGFGFAFIQGAMVKPSDAVRALETQGYSDVHIIGEPKWVALSWRGCGGGDAALYNAQAKNPIGKQVDVFVCVGWWFKGSTVRSN